MTQENIKKAIITVGCSASGKSTYAEALCNGDPSFVEVNRDNIRFPDGKKDWTKYKFNKKNESAVQDVWQEQIDDAITQGKNIIISDTNLVNSRRNDLVSYLDAAGYSVHVECFDVPFDQLLKRDNQREGGVGYEVLLRQYISYQQNINGIEPYKNNDGAYKPKAYICDIDGTVADNDSRDIFNYSLVSEDKPIDSIVNIVSSLYSCGYTIIFVSGREDYCYDQTKRWIADNIGIPMNDINLLMRETDNKEKDYKVKMDIFNKHIRHNFNVLGAIDDRKQVIEQCWIVLGIKTISVGNLIERF